MASFTDAEKDAGVADGAPGQAWGPHGGGGQGWVALPEEKANQEMEKERSGRKEGPEKQQSVLQGAGRALLWLRQTHRE